MIPHKHKWKYIKDREIEKHNVYLYICKICGEEKLFPFRLEPRQVFKLCRHNNWNAKKLSKVLREMYNINVPHPCQFCLIDCETVRDGKSKKEDAEDIDEKILYGYCNKCKRWMPVYQSHPSGEWHCQSCDEKVYKVVR